MTLANLFFYFLIPSPIYLREFIKNNIYLINVEEHVYLILLLYYC